jgi:hypothetical protein
MNIRFLKQHTPGQLTALDRIELSGSPDASLDGQYVVYLADRRSGDVTLVGAGRKLGSWTTVSMEEFDEIISRASA